MLIFKYNYMFIPVYVYIYMCEYPNMNIYKYYNI